MINTKEAVQELVNMGICLISNLCPLCTECDKVRKRPLLHYGNYSIEYLWILTQSTFYESECFTLSC